MKSGEDYAVDCEENIEGISIKSSATLLHSRLFKNHIQSLISTPVKKQKNPYSKSNNSSIPRHSLLLKDIMDKVKSFFNNNETINNSPKIDNSSYLQHALSIESIYTQYVLAFKQNLPSILILNQLQNLMKNAHNYLKHARYKSKLFTAFKIVKLLYSIWMRH